MDMEKRVGQYVAIRDEIRAIEERHKEELKKPNELLEKLAGVIHKFLDAHNLEMLRTDAGTCYISTTWRSSVQDPDAFMRFVIENREFDLLERRSSSTAVKAYVEEHNILPVGVNLNAISSVGVRRPNSKAKS
jgi:AAA+ superfamily predicted ATPase